MATLLLIDDDRIIRELLHELFSEDHDCDSADRAEQALQYIEFKEYDAVITDVFMLGIGGLQILKRIQEHHPMTPVIIISGKGDRFREFFMEMGAFAYFTKPFRMGDLKSTVTRAIAQRGHLNIGSCPMR